MILSFIFKYLKLRLHKSVTNTAFLMSYYISDVFPLSIKVDDSKNSFHNFISFYFVKNWFIKQKRKRGKKKSKTIPFIDGCIYSFYAVFLCKIIPNGNNLSKNRTHSNTSKSLVIFQLDIFIYFYFNFDWMRYFCNKYLMGIKICRTIIV